MIRQLSRPNNIASKKLQQELADEALAEKLVLAWAWYFFALNTALTLSIVYKIT
jgi:hypothetical protein